MKYYKLGKHASVFHDPKSGLTISNRQVGSLDDKKVTKKIKDAIGNGHLIVVTKEEFEKAKVPVKDASTKSTDSNDDADDDNKDDDSGNTDELEGLDKEALIEYAKENLEGISKKEIKALSEMDEDELKEYIKNW